MVKRKFGHFSHGGPILTLVVRILTLVVLILTLVVLILTLVVPILTLVVLNVPWWGSSMSPVVLNVPGGPHSHTFIYALNLTFVVLI